jgi:cytochrome c nitrite reductase small subunit
VRPGIEGWLRDKAGAGTKDVAIYLFGAPTDPRNLQAKVDSAVCLSCHRNILRMSEVAPRDLPPPVNDVGLVMSHRKHIEAVAKRGQGEGCTTYHFWGRA